MDSLNSAELDAYVQGRYQVAIDYYRAASETNKRWYKLTRILTVVFGALVTLIAALSSSEFIVASSLEKVFALMTPVLAAALTIIAGFSQNFQWGSTWQNMILTSQKLQKEYDSYLVTPEPERDYSREVDKLNGFIISESEGFFDRMLGNPKDANGCGG